MVYIKIIKSGLTAKDGIYFHCKYCSCEFLIENKNDWIIEWLKDPVDMKKHIEYYIRCPECQGEHYIGQNPNKCGYNLISPYHIMFDRDDWEERYEVKN